MMFDNLKIEADLRNDFALHLLIQNIQLLFIEKVIPKRGESSSYKDLYRSLWEVGQAKEYIWTAHHSINPFAPRPGPLRPLDQLSRELLMLWTLTEGHCLLLQGISPSASSLEHATHVVSPDIVQPSIHEQLEDEDNEPNILISMKGILLCIRESKHSRSTSPNLSDCSICDPHFLMMVDSTLPSCLWCILAYTMMTHPTPCPLIG